VFSASRNRNTLFYLAFVRSHRAKFQTTAMQISSNEPVTRNRRAAAISKIDGRWILAVPSEDGAAEQNVLASKGRKLSEHKN
jgi:hypothetical protein